MKKPLLITLVVLLFLSVQFYCAGESGSFLIMDAAANEVLEEENGYDKLPMASTTKVMTGLVVLENVSLDTIVKIPAAAVGVEGTSLYIKENEQYTVEELLYGLLLRSANDCAVALALYVGNGSEKAFVEMMNLRGKALGISDTSFVNPHGLPDDNHYTTAYDLAIIMREAMKNDDFRRITAMKSAEIKGKIIHNHNKLLSLYEGCIGGKTGYTLAAGRCLVTMAEKENVSLICVTLGRRNDWNIHTDSYNKWFSKSFERKFYDENEFYTEVQSSEGQILRATNGNALSAKRFKEDSFETVVRTAPFIYANKKAGAVIGSVEIRINGEKIVESPLILADDLVVDVKKDLFITRLFQFFNRFFLKYK